MKTVLLFDVNESLLDLRALTPHFERVFGNGEVLFEWFAQVLRSAMLTVITEQYSDFATVGRSALDMIAQRHGVSLSDTDRSDIVGGMRALPPHPDVLPGFEKLHAAGYRMASLTNSPPAVAKAQLENAGLVKYLDKIISVDEVKSLKPAAKVYRHAARVMGVAPGQARLIAAHSWDVAGAMSAGCRAAFIARKGMVLNPLFEAPDIVAPDLLQVAEQIIASDV
ncbi:MAG: haloacid dehalogenase type II [Betaproteobacteria bacterium]|jgi:2-haloacid dehalogenase|nr:MAG: haloacid dehalogenase type II [Betaproteobacteria bacterium]